jgi:hypothetical protein
MLCAFMPEKRSRSLMPKCFTAEVFNKKFTETAIIIDVSKVLTSSVNNNYHAEKFGKNQT